MFTKKQQGLLRALHLPPSHLSLRHRDQRVEIKVAPKRRICASGISAPSFPKSDETHPNQQATPDQD